MSIAQVQAFFPNLDASFKITSAATSNYNCIGWAANDDVHFWWPSEYSYWPIPHESVATVAAFEAAFLTVGYDVLGLNEAYDEQVEKVAIYIDPQTGHVLHMARQLVGGRWTSKLGEWYDIEHATPECLNGNTYGVYSHCIGRQRQPEPGN